MPTGSRARALVTAVALLGPAVLTGGLRASPAPPPAAHGGTSGSGGASPGGCQPERHWLGIEGCSFQTGTEPSGTVCVAMVACFTVDASCAIHGTAQGRYTRCQYSSPTGVCRWSIQCPDFTAPIHGQRVTVSGEELEARRKEFADGLKSGAMKEWRLRHKYRIRFDPSGAHETGTATCVPGVTVPWGPAGLFQMAIGSAIRNGKGTVGEVSPHYQVQTVEGRDAFRPQNLAYRFSFWYHDECDWSLEQFLPWVESKHSEARPSR